MVEFLSDISIFQQERSWAGTRDRSRMIKVLTVVKKGDLWSRDRMACQTDPLSVNPDFASARIIPARYLMYYFAKRPIPKFSHRPPFATYNHFKSHFSGD